MLALPEAIYVAVLRDAAGELVPSGRTGLVGARPARLRDEPLCVGDPAEANR